MKISIVTPTYNSEKYIQKTLDSIHDQAYKNIEHIVFDGLSTDKTIEIVKSYPQIKWISERDNGQSDALNKGFRIATGEILAWQNADDIYYPETFQLVVDYFNAHPEVDIVYSDYSVIDASGKWICNVYPPNWNLWLFSHARFVPFQPTVFWRRKVYEAVGELDEQLHYCMDVDFFAKASKKFTFAKIPKILGAFRVHEGSKTQQKKNAASVEKENKLVLSRSFNYKFIDYVFFFLFLKRRIVTTFIKMHILRK